MKRQRNTVISLLLSGLILIMGNFSSALSHINCKIGESGHSICEKECCNEENGCEEEENIEVVIADENDGCCKTHVEQAVKQENALLLINKISDNLKQVVRAFSINCIGGYCTLDFSVITNKFKTSNIPIELSSLRI